MSGETAKSKKTGISSFLLFLIFSCIGNTAFAIDASAIEEVMRKYQNKYHYVAVVNSFGVKYLTWSQLHCSPAPSYPINFYGEITENQADILVNDIVNKFYSTSPYSYSNISGYFLEKLPEGDESYQTVTITMPNSEDSWQNRLAQVSNDIDKLIYYRVQSISYVDYIQKSGTGYDSDAYTGTKCIDFQKTYSASFNVAKSEAESYWSNSSSSHGPVGVATNSNHSHSVHFYTCGQTQHQYTNDYYSAYARSTNIKLQSDLSNHTGSAHCFLKLAPYNNSYWGGDVYAEDGIASYNPVTVETDPNEPLKFYSWTSPSTGQIWTSDHLFSTEVPIISSPGRIISGPDEHGNYTAVNRKAWSLVETIIVVEPDFDSKTDPVLACSSPAVLIYKTKDKHVVYSANEGCGHSSGETVKGRIIINDYIPDVSMKLEVKLNHTFSSKVAELSIQPYSGGSYQTIDCDDTERVYCFTPQRDDPNDVWHVPFKLSAKTNEDSVSFTIATVYSGIPDPNDPKVQAYRSENGNAAFRIKNNGYECCNRKVILDQGNDIPQISKHENGDIEIFFPDIRQSYIWGSGNFYPLHCAYGKTCDFLDMSIAEYIPDGGSSGEYIKLFGSQGNTLVYSIDSGWPANGTAASASFVEEQDADGNPVKIAGYDANGRLSRISSATDPGNFFREYHYGDPATPNRITSYTDYAGAVSRTYSLVYDQTTGRLAGTVGGSGSGCGSCALPSENRLYFYNDAGYVLAETDVQGIVIHEYEYDDQNRLIVKWLGAKTNLRPAQEVVYDVVGAEKFGGVEIQDVYDYTSDSDYRFTRKILDTYGQTVTEIAFDQLNVDISVIGSDPNVIIASGGRITTYAYEYSGNTLLSISTRSPAFNEGTINTYYKVTLNNPSNNFEDTFLVTVDPNGVEPDEETVISRSQYAYYNLNGVSVRRLAYSYDARGIANNKYTRYTYSSNGPLSGRSEPGVFQLNGSYTELNYTYTYYPDGRIKTETVSNYNHADTRQITTYFYNAIGHPTGTETKDSIGKLLYNTKVRTNGFGEQIYNINQSGVARGKEYDAYGKMVSEFVFADPNDTILFDGNDPNALREDISSVYTNLEVISQKRYVYNNHGRLSEEWIAVADGVFAYNNPQQWYITSYDYDAYGRKYQKTEDTTDLALVTTYEYDNLGQLTKTTYPDGRWHKQIRNGRGLVTKTIDGYGPEDTYPNDFIVNETIYDADGNILKEISGTNIVASYELDNRGMVFRQYQGDYETQYCNYTEFIRDLDGRILNQITVSVDDAGDETVISKIKNRYNARGEQIEHRTLADPAAGENDLLDRVLLYNYDFHGRPSETITKADGNSQPYTNGNKDRVHYQAGDLIEQNWYDVAGNLKYTLQFEYAGDYATSYNLPFSNIDNAFRYTKASRNVSIASQHYIRNRLSERKILKGFDENDPYFSNWSYPQAGLVWQLTERYEYDSAGRRYKVIDGDDNFVMVAYNSRNQQTVRTLWQGTPILRLNDGSYDPNSFTPYLVQKTLTGYDKAGRQIRQVRLSDPNEVTTLETVNLAVDQVTDTVYDAYGRLCRQRQYFDGENTRIALTEYSYDPLGRIQVVEYGELEEAFWIDGSLFWETKTPHKIITSHYNAQNRKDQQTVAEYNTWTGQTADRIIYFGYDTAGRLIQTANADGTTLLIQYDALGRKRQETDATGKVAQYIYDDMGNLEFMIEDPSGLNRITGFEYDRLGRQRAIVSGNDRTEYRYDAMGNVEEIEYPNGDTIAYGYDKMGNVIRRTTTRDSEAITTHYKRDNLGRVSYKQHTGEIGWTEPNSLLPFDEILYDAMGNRSLMICVDNDNDVELNAYAYNGFGLMVSAFESFGGFGRNVGYGYDQRGLLTSLVYPNEAVVSYQRDALGRIESVRYNGTTLVEYGYLGNAVNRKVMAGADVEYAATIDALGRITGETYSRISDSQAVLDFDYDYHNHSYRLNERNGIDYGFDTLGRVISEDSASYTCDILGNPTNAPSSGLTYELDEEERIVQADDAVGTLAVYSYDRLGRRAMKTVGSTEIHFVYDLYGNIIAEYEDGQWTRDYVYGASNEAVYMQFPQTAAMGTALANFISFVEAWLCNPYCTQDDLVWDVNQDNQINLIDWSENVEYFEGAFTTNGRYLLTDFRNSVVGKVNPDGSVDEILYNAWGAPSVAQGTDLEGLTILWNGYYYDYETGNYYLRNRYYNPVERQFLTDDPHGINPDGNWNNPFFVFNQYIDGFGLQVYALGDPVNGWDGWGLQYTIGVGPLPIPPSDRGSGGYGSNIFLLPSAQRTKNKVEIALRGTGGALPNATKHLRYYLSNAGGTLSANIADFLKVQKAKTAFYQHINEAMAFVEQQNTTGKYNIVGTWKSNYISKGDNLDWFLATGGHWTSGTARVNAGKCKFKMEFKYHFHDWYNWDDGKSTKIFGITVTDAQMQELHLAGIAQEYRLTGNYTKMIHWEKGDRFDVSTGTINNGKGGR